MSLPYTFVDESEYSDDAFKTLKKTFGAGTPDENAKRLVDVVTSFYEVTQTMSSVKSTGQNHVLEALLWLGEQKFPLNKVAIDWDVFANKIMTITESKASLALIDEHCPAYLALTEKAGRDFRFDPKIRTGVNFGEAGLAAMLIAMPDYDINGRHTYSNETLLERSVMSSRVTTSFIKLMMELGADPHLIDPKHGNLLQHLNFMNDIAAYGKLNLLLQIGLNPADPVRFSPHASLELEMYLDNVPEYFDSFSHFIDFIDPAMSEKECLSIKNIIKRYTNMNEASASAKSSHSSSRKPLSL